MRDYCRKTSVGSTTSRGLTSIKTINDSLYAVVEKIDSHSTAIFILFIKQTLKADNMVYIATLLQSHIF